MKLKTPVPKYFKYVLQYCGYNNGISIATIEEDDIKYFVEEVRNGNVSKHFQPIIGEKNVLEGSAKTINNFDFSPGHKKFLIYIVTFVKNYLEQNGADSFTIEQKTSTGVKRAVHETHSAPRKRMRNLESGENFDEDEDEGESPETEGDNTAVSGMLRRLVNSAERNHTRKKPGYRHDGIIKMFAAFIKMIAGLLAYEILHANFPLSLPSVSTVNRFITDHGPQIVEGEMRTDELLEYLQSRNYPLTISLSEDATRITAKVSYDPKTNQLIGFALPLDKNGMPIKFSFQARNVNEIQKHFSNSSNCISSSAYVQMVQPMDENASPFCLMLYLTDNSFTANNVFKRWKFQANNLSEKGIDIYNISTDGDSKPLRAMKCLSRIGIQNLSYLDCEWFSCGDCVKTTFTQDVTHIITKARNRILKRSRIFPIGNKIISSSHLQYLVDNVSKDKHLLTRSDIEPKDRQNFLSAEKVCSEKTIHCLLDYVPGSEGTALYLKAVNNVLTAYLDIKIKSEERIYSIWYSVFFFRAWRSWLLNSEKIRTENNKLKSVYNLRDNFISSNCYTCIELNAHALVKKVLVEDDCCEKVRSKFFIPNLFGSQPCESMFRQVRSFTSTFSTVVNCNMLDIIHRIKKIQLQNDIINNSSGEINFPRFEKKRERYSGQDIHQFEALSRTKIISEIERARKAVICDMEELGIVTSNLDLHCQVEPVLEEDMEKEENRGVETDIDSDWDSDSEEFDLRHERLETDGIENESEEIQEDVNSLSGITGELILRDYKDNNIDLDESSPFVVVVDNKGNEMVVRKSSVCWLLSKDKFKLSSDRLVRVQEIEYTNNSVKNAVLSADGFAKNKEIMIGEWCIFYEKDDEESPKVLLGLVLGFAYLEGRTFKDREYSKPSAKVESDLNKRIGVLYSSYTFNAVGELTNISGEKHKFDRIEQYVGTIKPPSYTNKKLTISKKLLVELGALMN